MLDSKSKFNSQYFNDVGDFIVYEVHLMSVFITHVNSLKVVD